MKCSCGEKEIDDQPVVESKGASETLHMPFFCIEFPPPKHCDFCINGRCSGGCGA